MKVWYRSFLCGIFAIQLVHTAAVAQPARTVSGRVIDANNRAGLPGVNIVILNTVIGTSTDADGNFRLSRLPADDFSIRISMMGYETQIVFVTAGQPDIPDIALQETMLEIDPVVITASKWQEQVANTPAAVEVLTATDILKRSPMRIEDVLETAAGVQLIQDNVNIRGSEGYTRGVGSKVLVMIDDVPVLNSDFGAVNWFMISPADVQRVEIIRGGGSALYGSSAMGGVVNFITRSAGPQSRTYFRSQLGAYDAPEEADWKFTDETQLFYRLDFTHSRKINSKLGVRISGGHSNSDGYTEKGRFNRYNISGKIDYNFGNSSKLVLYSNYMHDQSDIFIFWKNQRNVLEVPPNQLDKEQTQDGLTLFGKYTIATSTKSAFEFRVYYNRFLLGTQFTEAGTFSPALGLGSSVQGNWVPHASLSAVYGMDVKLDNVKSSTDLYGQRNAHLLAPYLQLEWQFQPKFNLTVGGRYDRYDVGADPDATFGDRKKYDHFSPKVGLNYRPRENVTLRASAANGFKFPYVAQLFLYADSDFFVIVPSPNLRSEISWTYEIGYRQKIASSWFWEINAFYTDVTDLIEPSVSINNEVGFANVERAKIPGIELVTSGRWWRNRIGLRANFLLMNPVDETIDKTLLYRHKFVAFIAPSLRLGNFELQVDYKYASRQDRYGIFPLDQRVPQRVIDSRLFYYWNHLTFFVGVNNLNNYNYTLRDRYLEEIRNYMVGFSAEL